MPRQRKDNSTNKRDKNTRSLKETLETITNDYITLFDIYNNSNDFKPIKKQLNIIFNNIDKSFKDVVEVMNLDLVSKVNQIKKSFEELSYDLELLITNILYSSDNPFTYSTSGGFLYEIETNDKNINYKISEEINKLLDDNDIEIQLQDLLNNIISYGYSYIYFYNGYSRFIVLSPEDIIINKIENNNRNIKRGPYKTLDKFIEYRLLTNISTAIKDINNYEIYIKNSDINIDPNYLYIMSNKPGKIYGESVLNKAIKYLLIISILEIIQTIERIGKSKILHLILFDISEMDHELVMKYSGLYSNILRNRLALNINETGEFSFDYIKGLVDNYALIPTEGKDKIRIESLKSEYKPVNQDLYYQQKKVYLALGLPSQLHTDINEQATTMPSEYYRFTTGFLNKKIKHYRGIIAKFISLWIKQYLFFKYNKDFNVNIKILDYSEYKLDTEYLNNFIDAIFKLVGTGMMIKEDWLIKTIFPNMNIDDIIIRGNEDQINEEYVDKINNIISSSNTHSNILKQKKFNNKIIGSYIYGR